MKIFQFKILLWLFTLTSLSSCTLAFDEIEKNGAVTPEVAVPLLETTMRLDRLIGDIGGANALQIKPDGSYEFQYKGSFVEKTSNILASLPKNIVIANINDPSNLQNPRTVSVPFPSPANMRLDSVFFKGGSFKYSFTNPNAVDVFVNLEVPDLFESNSALFVAPNAFILRANQTITESIALKDRRLKIPANQMLTFKYSATSSGDSYNLTGSYEYANMDAQKAAGYFGQIPINLDKQTLNFDFFKNWKQEGDIKFSNPSMLVTVENGFGFPIEIKSRISEANLVNNSKMPLTSPFTNGIGVSLPNWLELGTLKTTTTPINASNSNLKDVFNAFPKSVDLAVDALSNPDLLSTTTGFISDNSKLRVKVDATIPFTATLKNFVGYDTLDINLSSFTDARAAEFKVITENGLPLDIGLQAYFLSSSGSVIDSLVTGSPSNLFRSAATFSNGQVVGNTSVTSLINMSEAKFAAVKNARKIRVKYQVTSALDGTVPVKLSADQKFSFRIGVRSVLKI